MPTYEYVCTECGKQLEVVQSFTDDALTECPACAGRLRKLFGNVGVSFKGSGFYKTDSRSGGASSKSSSASTPDSGSASSSESKSSDSKPAEPKPSSSDASSSSSKAS